MGGNLRRPTSPMDFACSACAFSTATFWERRKLKVKAKSESVSSHCSKL